MTSFALHLRDDLRTTAVDIILNYLHEPQDTNVLQRQKMVQNLVTDVFTKYRPQIVLCLPLPGKPDTRLPLDPLLKTPRPRVLQEGQKDDTCTYYAMQKIRIHIGKNSPKEFNALRSVEENASEWRKEKSQTGDPLFFPEKPYAIYGDPELARL